MFPSLQFGLKKWSHWRLAANRQRGWMPRKREWIGMQQLETAETRMAFKFVHLEGMLRSVERSVDVGLTFFLQYV